MTQPLTFCISCYNNLPYLKLAVHSVRNNSHFTAPFIIHAENCTDGTDEWLKEVGANYGLEYYIEKNAVPRGIGGGMNFCASKVSTEYIMFLHADFVVGKNWDIAALNVFEKYPNTPMWVSSYRIQPNIFNEDSRPGTLIVPREEFGEYHHNFQFDYFTEWANQFAESNDLEIRKGEGVSGLIRKTDWNAVGGNDDLFAPAYYEDYDLFSRMQLANYKFVLTSKSVVYHFGSRASRFPDDNLGVRPEHLSKHEQQSFIKWMKKWGKVPQFDDVGFVMPIYGTNNPTKV
jgi:GT2 family glycosyltransferase